MHMFISFLAGFGPFDINITLDPFESSARTSRLLEFFTKEGQLIDSFQKIKAYALEIDKWLIKCIFSSLSMIRESFTLRPMDASMIYSIAILATCMGAKGALFWPYGRLQ